MKREKERERERVAEKGEKLFWKLSFHLIKTVFLLLNSLIDT